MQDRAPHKMPNEPMIGPDEARIAPRTNMFIAAILQGASGACPVRIRNMSRNGALIEGLAMPPQGLVVALVRGQLRATGEIAWRVGDRCGVRLYSTIAVTEWLANSANRQQGQIDRIVAEIKGGLAGSPAASAPSPMLPVDVREDIDLLRLLLEAMGDDLTGAPATLIRHAATLQHLDIAGQMLDALKQALDPDSERRRIGLMRLQSLRQSGDAVLKSAA